jgi:hypothetical protein
MSIGTNATTTADDANTSRGYRRKLLQPLDPLFQQFLSVYESKGVYSPQQSAGTLGFTVSREAANGVTLAVTHTFFSPNRLLNPGQSSKFGPILSVAFSPSFDPQRL